MLAQAGIRLVADVRAIPRSRYNPQFNADSLAQFLSESGIAYEHLPELGGRRGPPKIEDGSPNMGWENESFRNYAGYARHGRLSRRPAKIENERRGGKNVNNVRGSCMVALP